MSGAQRCILWLIRNACSANSPMPVGMRAGGSGSGAESAISGSAVCGSSSNKGDVEDPPRRFGTGRAMARHRPRTIKSRNTGGAKTPSKIDPLSGIWKPSSHSLCDGGALVDCLLFVCFVKCIGWPRPRCEGPKWGHTKIKNDPSAWTPNS